MKLRIIHKLFIVASLPIITLLLYSLTHINAKNSELIQDTAYISKISIMRELSSLLHTVQIERGASVSILQNIDHAYFLPLLKDQKKQTDTVISKLLLLINSIDSNHLSLASQKYIKNLQNSFKNLEKIRQSVLTFKVESKIVFEYYTDLNKQLLSLFNSFKLSSNSIQTSTEITALYNLISLQEYAGQERALVAKLASSSTLHTEDMQEFHKLLNSQNDKITTINLLLEEHRSSLLLQEIYKNFTQNYFYKVRKEIINHESEKLLLNKIFKIIGLGGLVQDLHQYSKTNDEQFYLSFLEKRKFFNTIMSEYMSLSDKKDAEYFTAKELKNIFNSISKTTQLPLDYFHIITLLNSLENHHITVDSTQWFQISTQRIDQMHTTENILFDSILKSLKKDITKNKNLLEKQILITFLTIFFLLLGTFYLANKIKYSIKKLEQGINDFFVFLDTGSQVPAPINTHSNDEINDMAQSINLQMLKIDKNLEQDKDFIDETTQIVMLMKDGNFSERPYFQPHNPNLLELKHVFNQLTDLIEEKIKQQTKILEELNTSLEDRVHFQTLELEKQIQEITIAMDKAIQAEIAKDEFLANMSHEIRTPLNAILGFVTILKKQIKEEKPLNYLNIIDKSGKSLLTIINDILDFSKIKSGKFTITPYELNIIDEMSNATLLFASKAYEKHHAFSVFIDPRMPQTISVDAVRVKQIFSNILSNAIKFTPEDGTIEVDVLCEASKLIVKIKDTGIGIAEENLAKVFSAFEQADGSTTRKYGGTGLGLAISHKLAQLMDGDLTLSSIQGVGSTFTLEVPITIINKEPKQYIDAKKLNNYKIAILDNSVKKNKKGLIKRYLNDLGITNIDQISEFQSGTYDLLFFTPDDEYNEDIVESSTPAIALLRNSSIKLASLDHIKPLYIPYTPKSIAQAIDEASIDKVIKHQVQVNVEDEETQFIGSILVAEDNKTNQMLISLILSDYGLKHKIANNGLEAVAMFKEENFDLVLMDENMPELNGIGAMQQIKAYEKDKKLTFTPIIALTASVLDTDKEKFINAGMDGFVGKPINNNELESELGRFLEKKI